MTTIALLRVLFGATASVDDSWLVILGVIALVLVIVLLVLRIIGRR
jgi:hypothetical protein